MLKAANWGEHIAEDTVSNFEAEYGNAVYETFSSAEESDARLAAGDTGFDVVGHAGSYSARLIDAGKLAPLDFTKLGNVSHMDPEVMAHIASDWDPENKHFIPYMWGTHDITDNRALVLETHLEAPIGSVDMILDPVQVRELAECGVSFLEPPGDMIPMALVHLGLDLNSTDPDDYRTAAEMLSDIRPYIGAFDNFAYLEMPEEAFCAATTWGPGGLTAMSRAQEAGKGVVPDFFLPPRDGAVQLWIDGWAIPADAVNVEDAHLLLNYMMRPQVAADSNYTWYATANLTAKPMIEADVTSSPAAHPTEEQIAQLHTIDVLPPEIERLQNRTCAEYKAGQ